MYEQNKIGDADFGINTQALAVFHFIKDLAPDFADYKDGHYNVSFNSYPWYNGRERGIVISMKQSNMKGKCLHIAFFEHRNSDQICTLKWETEHFYFNHPLEDAKIFEKAYQGKSKYDIAAAFEYGEVSKCADWIYNTFAEFYKLQKQEDQNEKNKKK